MAELTPVGERERVVTLDVLRGFALLGVLIGNTFWLFSARGWLGEPEPRGIDQVAHWFVTVVVESKAQTMLTFLFGFGFAAQLLRAQDRGEPVMGVYVRRLLVLFGFGALHVTLLWWGDVTWTYGVAGFGLLLFLRVSDRVRIVSALFLTFVPVLIFTQPAVRAAAMSVFMDPAHFKAQKDAMVAAIQGTSYVATMSAHVKFALAWETAIYGWYFFWLIGRFLFGYVAGTQRWFANEGAERLGMFRRFLWIGLALGLASSAFEIALGEGLLRDYEILLPGRIAIDVFGQAGLLGMTAAYIAIIVLLMQRPAWRRVLRIIAPAGRMPLTTYIAQSVISTFLYYGWGLGWAGHTGAAACLGACFAVYAVQVALAHVWLRYFRFGPLEWIWRTLVYLRAQPMRVAR